jgi:5'(3')-deoxyribonucleotidase
VTATLIQQQSTLTGPGSAGMTPTLTFDIGVDVDDVLHPWFNTAHSLCEAAGITNGAVPTIWRMYEAYGCDVEVWADVLDQATEAGTLYGVPPIPGAVEALRRLHWAGHRIHLVTARGTGVWQTTEQRHSIHRQTNIWVEEHAVPHESLIFESNKPFVARELGLDYFIDDGIHNFEDLEQAAPGCQAYLLTAPHNGDYWTPFRLETMDEFADLVIEAGEKGAQGGC